MERQWFVESAPRTSRALYTIIGSVVLHGSIIAVAALWPVRETAPAKPLVTVLDSFVQGDVFPLPPSATAPESIPPDAAEPTPLVDASTDTPPPLEEPPMADPAPPPPSKTVVSRARSLHPLTAVGTRAQSGTASGARNAVGAVGESHPGAAGKWNTPQPPYPYAMRAARVQGSGSVRITTDGAGRVVSVSVVRSTGNPVLDANTGQFARTSWSGPPDASVTVPITYQMR